MVIYFQKKGVYNETFAYSLIFFLLTMFVLTSTLIGRACIWQDELEECYIQNSVHKVTAGAEILPLFLLYQFSAFGGKGVFKAIVNRVSIAHLTQQFPISRYALFLEGMRESAFVNFLEQSHDGTAGWPRYGEPPVVG